MEAEFFFRQSPISQTFEEGVRKDGSVDGFNAGPQFLGEARHVRPPSKEKAVWVLQKFLHGPKEFGCGRTINNPVVKG